MAQKECNDWDSATKLRNECLGFIQVVFLFKFQSEGEIMLLSTQWDAVRWKKNPASFKPACVCGGGGGGVAHVVENDTVPQKNSP